VARKTYSTSTKTSDNRLVPWLAAEGPLAYTPERAVCWMTRHVFLAPSAVWRARCLGEDGAFKPYGAVDSPTLATNSDCCCNVARINCQ
jgi:hypothetical protein